MKLLHSLSITTLAIALSCGAVQAMNMAAANEVIKLSKAGLGDDGIIAFIKSKDVRYDLSADDVLNLKNQGLSSAVLATMLSSGSTQPVQTSPAGTIGANPVPSPSPTPATQAPPLVSINPQQVATSPTVPIVAPPNVSADAAYFYQQLSPYGRWFLAEDNIWYWQPNEAVGSSSWRPYWDQGRWVYTDAGWYWTSDYSWGWAPFHYGRWRLHPLHGWIWFPDRVWAPAWVTWRSGGEYAGWAPLPPGTYFDPAGVLMFRGHHVAVDFDFGFDWHHFNFCRVGDLGESRRFGFRRDDDRRRAFFRTTIINQYTVNRVVVENRPEIKVINRGIEPARVAEARHRPVETVRVQEMHTPAPNRAHERFDKNHQTLEVYRPHWDHR